MLQRAVGWLLGKAGEGQRKYVFCQVAMALLFIFMMWGAKEVTAQIAAISGFVTVVITFVTGNVKEWQAKAGL